MSQDKNDDLAKALHALTSGEHVDDHDDHPNQSDTHHSPAPNPPSISAPKPTPTKPVLQQPPAPPQPVAPSAMPQAIPKPTPQPTQVAAPRPSSPARPSAPATPPQAARPATPRPQPTQVARPSAPVPKRVNTPLPAAQHFVQTEDVSTESENTYEAPPQQQTVYAQPQATTTQQPQPVSYASPKRKTIKKKVTVGSIEFRRLLIPSCLVIGTFLPAGGVYYFLQPDDAAVRSINIVVPITLIIVGLVVLLVGLFNMMLVARDLQTLANNKRTS